MARLEATRQASLFDGHDAGQANIVGKTIEQTAGTGGNNEKITQHKSKGPGGRKFKCPEPVKVARHWDGVNFINAETGEYLCRDCKTNAGCGVVVRGRVYCSKCGKDKK